MISCSYTISSDDCHASILRPELVSQAQLTMRYKLMSALDLDFWMGAMVRRSSPGMTCLYLGCGIQCGAPGIEALIGLSTGLTMSAKWLQRVATHTRYSVYFRRSV